MIAITPEEKQRLERQNWTAADGVDPAAMFVAERQQYRLGHATDGACVFLDAAGSCRIHTKFGEAAKPLACRLYPLVIHPAGNRVAVGLRFSCPSAAANRGLPLSAQAKAIRGLAALVVPEDYQPGSPPPIADNPEIEWLDFLRFIKWLDLTLAAEGVPVALKLLRGLHWLNAVEKGSLDGISGPGADEILEVLVRSAGEKQPCLPAEPSKPSAFGQLFLRLLVLEQARTVTTHDSGRQSAQLWRKLFAALRLVRANGRTPALSEELRRVDFSDIEKRFGPLSAEAEALLTRYFRVKVQSLHFCGRAFYDRPLIEGFRFLALMFPVVIWLARWLALSAGRAAVEDGDVIKAVTLVDYQYSYAPYLGWRTRLLQQRNDIVRLCAWYAR
jgi:lysine-N-methylase